MRSAIILLGCTGLLAGCGGGTPWVEADKDEEKQAVVQPIDTSGMPADCFYIREANDWEALNRFNVVVYAPNQTRPYLLTISPPSVNMRSGYRLRFESGSNRICGYAGDTLIVDRGSEGQHAVLDVRRLDAETLVRLKEEAGLAKKAAPKAKDTDKDKPGSDDIDEAI